MKHDTQVEILEELLEQLEQGRNIDAGVQVRAPVDTYVCPEVAERERDELFRNHPQLIGLSGDLPETGSYMTIGDFGIPILATRDKDGHFHAFLNACRHRSVQVATDARGTKNVFTCPFHMWSYRNTGDLVNVPDEGDFGDVDRACNSLLELPAVERDGLLWIHPTANGDLDLDELLGKDLAGELASWALSDLRYTGEYVIEKRLNWKFANDTFGETYHFQKLHKNTLGQLYIGNNLHLREFGRHHRFVTANHAIRDLRETNQAEWLLSQNAFVLYYLFPNVQLLVAEDNATLVRIYPDADDPSRSTTKISFYFSEEAIALFSAAAADGAGIDDVYDRDAVENSFGLDGIMEVFYSTVELEDYEMGEMQQRAAESGIIDYVVFGRNEPALHHFHRSFRDALGLPPCEIVAVAAEETA